MESILRDASELVDGVKDVAPVIGGAIQLLGTVIKLALASQTNTRYCQLLGKRLNSLREPLQRMVLLVRGIDFIEFQTMQSKYESKACRRALAFLVEQLVGAKELVENYKNYCAVRKFVQAHSIKTNFDDCWEMTSSAICDLQFGMQVDQASAHNEADISASIVQLQHDLENQEGKIIACIKQLAERQEINRSATEAMLKELISQIQQRAETADQELIACGKPGVIQYLQQNIDETIERLPSILQVRGI